MRLSDIHIQGILGFAGSVLAALITGFCSGKSWEAQMAEKIYNDNSVLQNKIIEISQEKEELKNKYKDICEDLNTRNNEYEDLKKKYETAMYNYKRLQTDINAQHASQKAEIPQLVTDSSKHNNGDLISLMKVAAPYDFHEGRAYVNGRVFTMSGVDYTDGFVLNANSDGYALINLNHKYSKISFLVGHIDKTSRYRDATLSIISDKNIIKEVEIANDLPPQKIEVQLNYAGGVKIQMNKGTGSYGFANIILSE